MINDDAELFYSDQSTVDCWMCSRHQLKTPDIVYVGNL